MNNFSDEDIIAYQNIIDALVKENLEYLCELCHIDNATAQDYISRYQSWDKLSMIKIKNNENDDEEHQHVKQIVLELLECKRNKPFNR